MGVLTVRLPRIDRVAAVAKPVHSAAATHLRIPPTGMKYRPPPLAAMRMKAVIQRERLIETPEMHRIVVMLPNRHQNRCLHVAILLLLSPRRPPWWLRLPLRRSLWRLLL